MLADVFNKYFYSITWKEVDDVLMRWIDEKISILVVIQEHFSTTSPKSTGTEFSPECFRCVP